MARCAPDPIAPRLPLAPDAGSLHLRAAGAERLPLASLSPVLADIARATPWSLGALRVPRAPVAIDQVPAACFAPTYPSVLDCCIRLPGMDDLVVPAPFAPLAEILERLVRLFRGHDPLYDARHLYLTVDQRTVCAGESQRIGGFHVDGLQGPRFTAKLPVCYQVLVSDAVPTLFAEQPFAVEDVDLTTTNLFRRLDALVDPTCVRTYPARTLLWTNGHTVHASAPATHTVRRTFLRLEASLKPFDRDENTRNPGLTAPWTWVPRPIPPDLR